jgi:hypothetical protein
VLSLQQVRRLNALADVGRMKAELASQSGITKAIEACRSIEAIHGLISRHKEEYSFSDQSHASVEVAPWGVYLLMKSEGSYKTFRRSHSAVVAEIPGPAFKNALVFANPTNQLVMAGTAAITGDIVVGQPGVTTGNLRHARTPPRLPISGVIRKELRPQLPEWRTSLLESLISEYHRLLNLPSVEGTRFPRSLDLTQLNGSVSNIDIQGDAVIYGSIIRREKPLTVAVRGSLTISESTSALGLITLISSAALTVPNIVNLEHVILVSEQSIEVRERSTLVGQLIAPKVKIGQNASLLYPSAVVSIAEPADSQYIDLEQGVRVEGIVSLLGLSPTGPTKKLVRLSPEAHVTGCVYSEDMLTLDGEVRGTVITRNLYFYEAPTIYHGWMRMGMIDRPSRPEGFLLPIGFSTTSQLTVLDWL